ncbi:hypothetical protein [Nocardia sp. NPDC050406]|uniref:hypothetical protein n=1 Tax=Nocardia sp. NPDC050406 TaxID=3364318 RepID=UPI0037A12CB5
MTPPSLLDTSVLHQLKESRRVLIAGAGGGFDVLSGLPLALALWQEGKEVFLANLTFTAVGRSDAPRLAPGLFEVTADVVGPEPYFPEKHLATWLRTRGHPDRIFLIQKGGALDAVAWVQNRTPGRESIVCASISDATRGEFGNHHSLPRTRADAAELFINPLMSMAWGFDLTAVADRVLYRTEIEHTTTPFEVAAIIEAFRDRTTLRPRRTIPV